MQLWFLMTTKLSNYSLDYTKPATFWELQGWSIQDTGKQKRKIVEVKWAIGRKLRTKALPLGFIKFGATPPGFEDDGNFHPIQFDDSHAHETSGTPLEKVHNINLLYLN